MRKAVAKALLSVVALAGMGSPAPALAQDGRSLFERHGCGGCHGAAGTRPVLPMYPRLAGQDAEYAFNQMKDLRDGERKNGLSITVRGVLVPLSDEELRALADYLASVTPGEASLEEAELLGRFEPSELLPARRASALQHSDRYLRSRATAEELRQGWWSRRVGIGCPVLVPESERRLCERRSAS